MTGTRQKEKKVKKRGECVGSTTKKKTKKMRDSNGQDENFSRFLEKELEKNIENLKIMLGDPTDLVVRQFPIGGSEHRCAIAYIDGLVNEDLVQSHMMKNVQLIANSKQLPDETTDLFEVIYDKIISAVNTEKGYTLDDLSLALLSGDTLFYLDGIDQVLISDTKFWES